MVRVRNLLVMSLASAVFCNFVKTECVQAPPCLKTRVLQSSPEVPPKKECTECEEKLSEVQKENYVLAPIESESSYKQPQAEDYLPQDHGSDYRHKFRQQQSRHPEDVGVSHQQTSPQETDHGPAPQCDTVASCQSNFYLLQSSTQVINHIQQQRDQKQQSYPQVPRYDKPIVKQPSYHPGISGNPRPNNYPRSKITDQVTPLHHLAKTKIGRPGYVNEPIEKAYKQKYQPVRVVYSKKPRVSEYGSVPSPQETKRNYSGKTSYERKKTDEIKLGYGTAPTKQTSCQKCQRARNGSPTKGNYDYRGGY